MDIRLVKLHKQYNGKTILKDLDMTFTEGTISCIMGASGRGKTTLVNILMGLVKQDGGDVLGLQGVRCSAVFQEDRLIEHWDAVKNVRLVCGKEITDTMIKEQLGRTGLEDITDKPVRAFSGGMRRRVAIVRALLAESSLILLDEPFKGLDEALKEQIINYLKEQAVGKTVIVVTHDRKDAELLGAKVYTLL